MTPAPGPTAPVLRLVDADIGYGGPSVVSGASLTVAAGEVVALLGANGSGKSTLVRGVLGLARHQAGSIELFGRPLSHHRARWRIGYVPQRESFVRGIPATVTEIVRTGRLARVGTLRRFGPDDDASVRRAIEAVGLGSRRSSLVGELSGGQQRRVLVARALAGGADLLVLDEPTAGVDTANQRLLAQALQTLADEARTILLVAHELGPAAPIVTRVLAMRDGTIAYDGPPRPSDLAWPDDHHLDDHHLHGRHLDAFGLGA